MDISVRRRPSGRIDKARGYVAPRESVLKYLNSNGVAAVTFTVGGGGTLVPLRGDWEAAGTTGRSTAVDRAFPEKHECGGAADIVFTFGVGGANVADHGDWDNDGTTPPVSTIRRRAPSSEELDAGAKATGLSFGARAVQLVGDWNNDGTARSALPPRGESSSCALELERPADYRLHLRAAQQATLAGIGTATHGHRRHETPRRALFLSKGLTVERRHL